MPNSARSSISHDNATHCRICGAGLRKPFLAMGDLPPCNRFEAAYVPLETHPLTLAGCETCGFIQLVDPMPVAMIAPRVSWIRYNEPDGHLDDLMARLAASFGRSLRKAIGLSPFEGPLHSRLQAQGVETLAPVLPVAPPPGRHAYLETWQGAVEDGAFAACGSDFDIVSCRYILEHCHDPKRALHALGALAAPDGLVMVEVPDSGKFLRAGDYAFPWEEHVSYFTEESLIGLCAAAGFELAAFIRYPGQLEDALVAVLRKGKGKGDKGQVCVAPPPDLSLFPAYRDRYAPLKARVQTRIAALAGENRDQVALFGVGHQAIMFANTFGVAPLLAAVVDDDANKRGTIAPGFAVPVTSSAALKENGRIRTCLLAVAPRVEPKIRELLKPLADRGVSFHSIFAGVPGSILAE